MPSLYIKFTDCKKNWNFVTFYEIWHHLTWKSNIFIFFAFYSFMCEFLWPQLWWISLLGALWSMNGTIFLNNFSFLFYCGLKTKIFIIFMTKLKIMLWKIYIEYQKSMPFICCPQPSEHAWKISALYLIALLRKIDFKKTYKTPILTKLPFTLHFRARPWGTKCTLLTQTLLFWLPEHSRVEKQLKFWFYIRHSGSCASFKTHKNRVLNVF